MDYKLALVPGRGCGDCTVCCTAMAIDKPEIQKDAGVACRHCTQTGCAIYDTRPQLCRDYHCGWRQLPMLDDSWRPDRSGVFVELEPHDGKTAISLMLVGNPLKTVRQPWFIDFVATGVRGHLPLMLGIPGPPGREGASLVLNSDAMMQAARTSRAAVKHVLEAELKLLQAFDFLPAQLPQSWQQCERRGLMNRKFRAIAGRCGNAHPIVPSRIVENPGFTLFPALPERDSMVWCALTRP